MTITSEQIALEAASALAGKKAEDVRIFDVRGLSSVTDFYVVATGTSAPHLKALVAETQHRPGHAAEFIFALYTAHLDAQIVARQLFQGRTRPATAPGKSILGFWP